MPWYNKRTAGLPNPHTVGLQSHCSVLQGSLSLGLLQATALHRTHAQWDSHLSSCAGSTNHRDTHLSSVTDPSPPTSHLWQTPAPRQTHNTLGYPALSCTMQQLWAGLTAHWDTCPSAHHPSGPAEPQRCVGWPEHCTSGPARLQLCVEQLEAHRAGTGTSLAWDICIHQPAKIPAPWAKPAPALQAFPITTPPGSHRAATRLLQACLRDTSKQKWTLKE
jgi:hypothetical protein